MKKLFLSALVMALSITGLYAQCEKRVILTSTATHYLDASGALQREVSENSVVEFDQKTISIIPGNEENAMSGTINSYKCDWKQAFKEGKTVVKATLTDPSGQSRDLTITIEGKEGKISFLAELDDTADRKIKLVVAKFEEKKS